MSILIIQDPAVHFFVDFLQFSIINRFDIFQTNSEYNNVLLDGPGDGSGSVAQAGPGGPESQHQVSCLILIQFFFAP